MTSPQDINVELSTPEYLKNVIASQQERIEQLESHSTRVTQRDFESAAKYNGIKNDMRSWTFNELDQEDISIRQAQAIADICGFELTQVHSVNMTVDFTFDIEVPMGSSVEDMIDEIDVENISYSDIMNLNSQVVHTESDLMEI
jgi:hypothetical protein